MPAIPRELIDPDAEKVVRRLTRGGYQAYLVGGCVRDLLLGRQPKDFDVSTSATPREIKALFRNCRIIGRRFRLAHIFFGQKIIETSTFRANPRQDASADDAELLIRRDNVFGTDTEDARRRDFTINGLFYDVEREQVIDHVGGLADLEKRLIRTIGDPNIRFREDPVRMLRAVKFAARLGFQIEPETYTALLRHRLEVNKCAAPRVLEEFYRFMRGGAARRSLEMLMETGLAMILTPRLAALYGGEDPSDATEAVTDEDDIVDDSAQWEDAEDGADELGDDEFADELRGEPRPDESLSMSARSSELPAWLSDPVELEERRAQGWRILDQIDSRTRDGVKSTNALVLAALVAPFLLDDLTAPGVRPIEANERVIEVMQPLVAQLHIARRDAERTRQILIAQRRMAPSRRRRGRPTAMARRDYFDEAVSLYELMARAEGRSTEAVDRWRRLAQEDDEAQARESNGGHGKRRRRRRGGRRRRRSGDDGGDILLAGPPGSDVAE